MECHDCRTEGDHVYDDWELFDQIPLCVDCVDDRHAERTTVPQEWIIE